MRDKILETLHHNEMQLASTKSRALAMLIDELLVSVIVMFIVWDKIPQDGDTMALIGVVNSAFYYVLLIKLIYHAYFYYQYGATVGKIWMKIRVVEIRTLDNPTMFGALNRSGMRLISEMFFYFGFILALFDETKQTLHDRLARTIVVDL